LWIPALGLPGLGRNDTQLEEQGTKCISWK
jgi:hypothetical protein